MPFWIPLAMTAASLYAADQQGDAVDDAAARQTAASGRAQEFQRNALLTSLRQGYPIYQGQVNALNRLYSMQGMPSIQAADLNSLIQPFQQKGPRAGSNPVGSRLGGSSEVQSALFDPAGIIDDDAERYLFDPLDIF